MKAAGAIAGGIMQRRLMRDVEAGINTRQQENQDWYDRRYNEDATQRADAQRLLTMTEQSILRRNKEAAGAAAVMGGSPEAVAAAKAANNQALSETASRIAAQGAARQDALEGQYLDNKERLAGQLDDIRTKKAQAVGLGVKAVGDAAGSLAGV